MDYLAAIAGKIPDLNEGWRSHHLFRAGHDVLVSLALGAAAVLVDRPVHCGWGPIGIAHREQRANLSRPAGTIKTHKLVRGGCFFLPGEFAIRRTMRSEEFRNLAVPMTGDSTVVFSAGAQTTSTVAYDKASNTPDGNALAWRAGSECPTVIRVNGGLALNCPAPPQAKDGLHRRRTGQYSGVSSDWSVSNRGG
jgi:hypothetical protein